MSLDVNELVGLIQQMAVNAVNAGAPMGFCHGTVVSASPLKIMVDQKKTLSQAQLILTSAVRDHTVEMTVDHATESASGGSGESAFAAHSHGYRGKKTYTVHRALKSGEKVILLRCDGGQKYIVLDRWEEVT